jgi:hypothetical protein
MRARLREAGDAGNQVIIEHDPTSASEQANANAYELAAMDAWLNAIESDGSRAPSTIKIARNRPAGLADGCFLSPAQTAPTLQPGGLDAAGRSAPCENVYPVFANTRLAAGQPEDLYTLKCALTPIDWRAYGASFSAAAKAQLQNAFPSGVCDYRRPGPQERPPIGPWLDYSRGITPFPIDWPFGWR